MKQVLIAIDQLANVLLGGYADETLSARAYRISRDQNQHWPRRVIDVIFFWDKNHCEESYLSEIVRRHLPRTYRTSDMQ